LTLARPYVRVIKEIEQKHQAQLDIIHKRLTQRIKELENELIHAERKAIESAEKEAKERLPCILDADARTYYRQFSEPWSGVNFFLGHRCDSRTVPPEWFELVEDTAPLPDDSSMKAGSLE
jgi:hypothetical protein